jgi:hypothetical protein
MSKNACVGTSFNEYLAEEGILAETTAEALKRALAWQIEEQMRLESISKAEMARRMKTSRSSLDRLLDPDNPSVTLHTLERAASALGKQLRLELVG